MQAPVWPPDEETRLRKLRELGLLDSFPDERFDRVTRLARRLFDVPIALITLIDADRQWFMSRIGLEFSETPRRISFCAHTILGDECLVVRDTLQDTRFADNPMVLGEPRIRFYAGAPLRLGPGSAPGCLCVMDSRTRSFVREDLDALRDLAALVERDLQAIAQAFSDDVTGLANRRGFDILAHQALLMCARSKASAALCRLRLEDFAAFADRHGHARAELQLQQFAQQLVHAFRGSDVVARLGDDDFVALATQASEADMGVIRERLRLAVQVYNEGVPPAEALRYRMVTQGVVPDAEASVAGLLLAA